MNDKDKSFFIKIILVSVAFVCFFIVLGLTMELARKNKEDIKLQRQIPNSPELTVAPIVKDETEDWKTYRNEELGFEFRYLLNITHQGAIKNISFDITNEVHCSPEDRINIGQDEYECRLITLFDAVWDNNLVIRVKEKPYDLDNLETYVKNIAIEQQKESGKAAAPFYVNLEKIKIGDQDGFSIVRSSQVVTELKEIEIYIVNNNHLYTIQYNYSNYYINPKNSNYDLVQKLKFDKTQEIISTFKFTN